MTQERDALSLRNVPIDAAQPPENGLYQYDSSSRTLKWVAPLAGVKIYWVSDTYSGVTNRKLTFSNGILTSEV